MQNVARLWRIFSSVHTRASMASIFEGGARQRAEKDTCELKQTKPDELSGIKICNCS